jgi:hypothetical protein
MKKKRKEIREGNECVIGGGEYSKCVCRLGGKLFERRCGCVCEGKREKRMRRNER